MIKDNEALKAIESHGCVFNRIGQPRENELIITANGRLKVITQGSDTHLPCCIIVKRKFKLPKIITSCYLYRGAGGLTRLSITKPEFLPHGITKHIPNCSLASLSSLLGTSFDDPFAAKEKGTICLAYWDSEQQKLTEMIPEVEGL